MAKDDGIYLGHMLDKAREAIELVQGKDRRDYDEDKAIRLALAHLVQVIGEAARRVSKASRERYPQIPWSAVVGIRNKVVHDYMDLDEDIVWETVSEELPSLIAELEKIVQDE